MAICHGDGGSNGLFDMWKTLSPSVTEIIGSCSYDVFKLKMNVQTRLEFSEQNWMNKIVEKPNLFKTLLNWE